MSDDQTKRTSDQRVAAYITGYVAEHGELPTVAQVGEGGVRARTATIAAVLRQARATAARERALAAASPEAIEVIMEVGRAMANAAQLVLDDEAAALVERLTAPVWAASEQVIAATRAERVAVQAELAAQEDARTAERKVLERMIASLRKDLATISTERDNALHACDVAFDERDRAIAGAQATEAKAGEIERARMEARDSARAALHQADVNLAEERGRRLAAEERVVALEESGRDSPAEGSRGRTHTEVQRR